MDWIVFDVQQVLVVLLRQIREENIKFIKVDEIRVVK